MNQPILEFRGVSKRFGSLTAVDRVGLTVTPGEIFTLLGPSGCGKTTTLRLVAGLDEPDDGEILLNGDVVAAPCRGIFVAPDKRQLGMVFQSYAIWPHLSVFENVAFPLKVRREHTAVIRKRVLEALETVGLVGFETRGVTELSGGQQQRVALARALVYTPALLLLDEPLSNLDAKLREQMRVELRALQRRLKLTVLYVTHDQTEAMSLSDRIAVVHRGRFEQVGTPEQVYENPATPFVGEFLGRTVTLEGKVIGDGCERWIELPDGERFDVRSSLSASLVEGACVQILTRPEDIEIVPRANCGRNQLDGFIEQADYLGDRFEYHVRAAGSSFVLGASKKERYATGARIRLHLHPEHLNIRTL
jgi:ABC-type Fe3+/spermidine/putrescine transport system ATPase subunit